LVTSIGAINCDLSQQAARLGFHQALRVPGNLQDGFDLLTPTGLLSSAFLGLDCIQLLVGAAAINENFRNEPFSTNLVLRFVASSLQRHHLFAWWARSLAAFTPWMATFQSHTNAADLAAVTERDRVFEQIEEGALDPRDLVCNHIHVDDIRTDPLVIQPRHAGPFAADDQSADANPTQQARTVGEIQDRVAVAAGQKLSNIGIRQNKIVLPVIDTHSLGQFIQLMMLSAVVRPAMRGADHFPR
ncbi:MAG: hypothetical protein KDB00_29385, partial [Planctomycetales bacterium]|nr:hypothetical protein [Planctomycetales bacterium]